MKHTILIIIQLFICSALRGETKTINSFMDQPLFDYTVQNNSLPYGDYILIRSFRNITQVIISKDYSIITLYTDRDNTKTGDIHCSSFSRLDSRILKPGKVDQWQFNHLVETCLLAGDLRPYSSLPYAGPEKLLSLPAGDLEKTNKYHDYSLKYRGKKFRWIDIHINGAAKNYTSRGYEGEKNTPAKYYSIYIEETHDMNIKSIIIKIIRQIKNLENR